MLVMRFFWVNTFGDEKKISTVLENDPDEGGKNLYEGEFLTEQLKRLGLNIKQEYYKITNFTSGKKLADNLNLLKTMI